MVCIRVTMNAVIGSNWFYFAALGNLGVVCVGHIVFNRLFGESLLASEINYTCFVGSCLKPIFFIKTQLSNKTIVYHTTKHQKFV